MHEAAWNGVVFGLKRWFLYPPTKSPPGGPTFGERKGGFSLPQWLSDVYPVLDAPNRPLECVQPKDSIMYLPENWYHAVVNIGDTIAASYQTGSFSGKTKLSKVLYEVLKSSEVEIMGESEQAVAMREKKRKVHEQMLEVREYSAQSLRDAAGYESSEGNATGALKLVMSAIEVDPFFIDAYMYA
jgi:hypothetical protein